jgi:ligand-binding sensor domain-containing protein
VIARAPARSWLTAVVLGSLVAPAGEAVALEPGLRFDQYTQMEWPSVAHSVELRGLALARDGRLWIATSEGLLGFDGQRLETAGHSLPPGRIQALVEDAGGAQVQAESPSCET